MLVEALSTCTHQYHKVQDQINSTTNVTTGITTGTIITSTSIEEWEYT